MLEVFVLSKNLLLPKEVQDRFIKGRKGTHLPLLVAAKDRKEFLVFCEDDHARAFARFLSEQYNGSYTSNHLPPSDYPWAQQAEAVSAILTRNNGRRRGR